MSAVVVGSMDDRTIVRCKSCKLVQFLPANGCCRKCKSPVEDVDDAPVVQVHKQETAVQPARGLDREGPLSMKIANSIRMARRDAGLSQRELAVRMNVPRTYVSKVENEKATPTLASLERIAVALAIPITDLLSSQEDERVKALVRDDFMAELIPLASLLDPAQQFAVIDEVRKLYLKRKVA